MNAPKARSPAPSPVQITGHSQPRNVVPHTSGPSQNNRVVEEQGQSQYTVYQNNIPTFIPGQYQFSQQQQQGGQQNISNELGKQSIQPVRLTAPAVANQQNMYQQQPGGMRPPQSNTYFQPNQPQTIRPTRYQMNQPQPGQQMAYQPVMYMPPSNTGSGYPVGQQIIVQPPNSLAQMPPSQLQQMGQQIIMQPGSRMPTAPYSLPQTQTGGGMFQMNPTQYTNPSTQPYSTVYYQPPNQQTQQSRPQSNPPVAQSRQEKREKKVLQIIDPNTGKDIMSSEVMHPPNPNARSTPPSTGSGSRGPSVGSTPPPAAATATVAANANAHSQGDIAAQFAAQVAATLKQKTTKQSSPISQTLSDSAAEFVPAHDELHLVQSDMSVAPPPLVPATAEPEEEISSEHTQNPPSAAAEVSIENNVSEVNVSDSAPKSLSETNVSKTENSEEVLTVKSRASNSESSVVEPQVNVKEPSDSAVDSVRVSESSLSKDVNIPVSTPQSSNNDDESTTDTQTKQTVNSVTVSVSDALVDNVDSEIRTSEEKEKSPVALTSESVVDEPSDKSHPPVDHSNVQNVPGDTTVVDSVSDTSVKDLKKGKKKLKDLNKKGADLQGSDMDAFIDKAQPEEKEEIIQNDVKPDIAPKVVEPEKTEQKEEKVEEVVPNVEIRIEDKVLEENEKNAEKTKVMLNNVDEKSDSRKEPELRYKYKEDQWSPVNLEGKRIYDREFLLQLQHSGDSTAKPAGLPDLPDIILDKPHTSSQKSQFQRDGGSRDFQLPTGGFDFTPGFVRGSPRPGGGGQGSITKRGSAQRGRSGAGSQQKVISHVSIQHDVKLHKAEDAWKPSHKEEKPAEDPESVKSEELYKKARSILNKLTPQKFQTLVKQMAELQIDSEARLKHVTDLIFEKAISEPGFSVAYASMCRYLTQLKVPSESAPGTVVNFRAILVTRCQKEFEKDKDNQIEIDKKRKEMNAAKEEDKKQLQEELEMAEWQAKRRSLGNIRFIGELFKLKMLTESIMHNCVLKLLKAKDEESLECLCRLLSTIGKELDIEKAKPRMDQYFNQMNKITAEKKTSSRVRFMLQDVIELRQNKWIPRRDENNPKTIDQIHKEVQLEEQERALMLQQAALQQRSQGGSGGGGGAGGNRRGSRGQNNPPQSMMSMDGWNTVGKSSVNVRQPIDPSRLKITKQNVDETTLQLGPGGGAGRFSGWQRGSTGGGARTSQEAEKPAGTPSNRFSALSKSEDENRPRFGVSPARGDGRGRQQGGFGRPPSRGITPRSSQEMLDKERAAAVRSARAIAGGQTTPKEGPSREGSRNREKESGDKVSAAPAKQLTVEEMEKKTISILDEFLHIQDIKEAILCVEELNSPSTLHTFVSSALNHVLERSEVARQQTGHLLHDLVKKEVVSVQSYLKGLDEILQFAEDMEIDIPKIWQYFGELIGPMIQDGSVPLSFLRQACEPLKASNKAGKLVSEVLHDASHREGHKKVGDLWRNSGLQWSDFVPAEEVKQFLKDKKLEFTDGDGSQPSTPTATIPIEKVQEKLVGLLTKQGATNEEVFDWIEANLDEKATKTKGFVRALMTSVCSSAISGSGNSAKVDPREIKNRGALLQKYLDHQAEFELQALFALQALVHKLEHPPGVLRTLFDTLYDEDIISEDAFNHWEKNTDPAEQEGKGVAMKQVVQFFTWLREAEDASDS